MLEFLSENLAVLITAAIAAGVVVLVTAKAVRDRKRGQGRPPARRFF